MALLFYFKAFKALRVTHFDSPSDDLRKHPASCGCGLVTVVCCLTDNPHFSYIEAPGHTLGLPGKETSF